MGMTGIDTDNLPPPFLGRLAICTYLETRNPDLALAGGCCYGTEKPAYRYLENLKYIFVLPFTTIAKL